MLCRREAGAFQRAAKSNDDLLVACTQESRLFLELAGATEGAPSLVERPIRFVNIRESGGWSKDAASALPKMAALIAAAQLAPPEPVGTVSYASAGRVLVIGSADRAQRAATLLADSLDVTLLLPHAGGSLAQERTLPVHTGKPTQIAGWLGAFEVTWTRANPIDADLCTRCNACIEVCPEQAIDFSYQIDLAKCTGHRDCVRACGAAAAIDFERAAEEQSERFDLVLDLQAVPQIALHQPPQGYFHAADDAALFAAVLRLRDSAGEFEKPKFFDYKQKICAHTRNGQIGCTACIDVCSAAAIRSDAQTRGQDGSGRHRRRAASLRRLRRLHDGVPERGADLCHAAPERARHAHPHDARDLRARRRTRRRIADPQRGRRRRRDRGARPRRARRSKLCTACRRASCRWRSATRRRSASISGSPRSPMARRRSGCW